MSGGRQDSAGNEPGIARFEFGGAKAGESDHAPRDACPACSVCLGSSWVKQLREWTTAGQVVWMRYRSTDKGELSDRVVEPGRCTSGRGFGTCGDIAGPRVSLVATGWMAFKEPSQPERHSFGLDGFLSLPPTIDPPPMTTEWCWKSSPRGHWVIEYYSMRILSEDPSGLVLAEFYTRDPRIAAQLALRLAPICESWRETPPAKSWPSWQLMCWNVMPIHRGRTGSFCQQRLAFLS